MRTPVGLDPTLDLTYSELFRRAGVAHLALRTQHSTLLGWGFSIGYGFPLPL